MSEQILTKYKTLSFDKPVYNKDGSVDYPIILSRLYDDNGQIVADRDGDLIDPRGIKGLETAVTSYRHNKCGGLPVDTGAEILRDTISLTEKEAKAYVRIKPTDELYFCDTNSIKKQSNGKLLDKVNNGQIKSVSIGFRYNPKDVEEKFIAGRKYYFYKTVNVMELSFLDTVSSNLSSYIIKSMNEKTKCLCGAEAGMFAVNLQNGEAVKLVSQEGESEDWKAVTFDREELMANGTDYQVIDKTMLGKLMSEDTKETEPKESVSNPEESKPVEEKAPEQTEEVKKAKDDDVNDEADKACSCQNPVKLPKEEKAPEQETSAATAPVEESDPEPADKEDVQENAMFQAILDGQTKIESKLEQMLATITKVFEGMNQKPAVSDEMSKMIKDTFAEALGEQTLNKFAKKDLRQPSITFTHKL